MRRSAVSTLLLSTIGATIACAIGFAPAAAAWSKPVHVLICDAAYELTSNAGRKLINKHGNNQWPGSCAWADDARRKTHKATASYHYLNVPEATGRADISMAVDCAAYDCVHQAVKRYAVYLAAPYTSRADRIEALKFLGHFVGDMHQPLHAAYLEDIGGNAIRVKIENRKRTLHSAWDDSLPALAGMRKANARRTLVKNITPAQKRAWRSLHLRAAVEQTFDLARSHAYVLPNGQRVRNGTVLRADYIERAMPVVRTQVARSAVQLAHILHVIGAGKFEPAQMH